MNATSRIVTGYYNQEGEAFNKGIENLSQIEMTSLIHFMKASALVANVTERDGTIQGEQFGFIGVSGYETTIGYDFQNHILTVKTGTEVQLKTTDADRAILKLTACLDRELRLRADEQDKDRWIKHLEHMVEAHNNTIEKMAAEMRLLKNRI